MNTQGNKQIQAKFEARNRLVLFTVAAALGGFVAAMYVGVFTNSDFKEIPPWVSALASTGATLVSILAVVLVARTLQATRDTLDATREMATEQKTHGDEQLKAALEATQVAKDAIREENRPFLYVEPVDSNFGEWMGGQCDLEWPIAVENFGRSAAVITQIKISATVSKDLASIKNWEETYASKANGMAPGLIEEFVLLPERRYLPRRRPVFMSLPKPLNLQILDNTAFVFMKIEVQYTDMYGDSHETLATFQQGYIHYRSFTAGGAKFNYRT